MTKSQFARAINWRDRFVESARSAENEIRKLTAIRDAHLSQVEELNEKIAEYKKKRTPKFRK